MSHNSRENLSQGGGGSSNGYGFYGSVTTAAAASSVGSSLGGMAFVSSPSATPDPHGGRPGGAFSWLWEWRKSSGGERAGAGRDNSGRGAGFGGGGPPSLWQRSLEHNNDYISSTQSPTALHESGSRSLDDNGSRGETGGGGEAGAVSRWWRGVVDAVAGRRGGERHGNASVGGEGREGAVGEASSLWKAHGSGGGGGGGGGKSHLSFGELSRATEVTYSLRGYDGRAEKHGAGDWGQGGPAERRGGGSGRVGAARGGEYSSAAAGRGDGGGAAAGAAAPVGVRQAVGW